MSSIGCPTVVTIYSNFNNKYFTAIFDLANMDTLEKIYSVVVNLLIYRLDSTYRYKELLYKRNGVKML